MYVWYFPLICCLVYQPNNRSKESKKSTARYKLILYIYIYIYLCYTFIDRITYLTSYMCMYATYTYNDVSMYLTFQLRKMYYKCVFYMLQCTHIYKFVQILKLSEMLYFYNLHSFSATFNRLYDLLSRSGLCDYVFKTSTQRVSHECTS